MWGNTGFSTKVNTFTNEYSKMDKEMQIFRLQMRIQEFNPVLPLVKLIAGGFSIIFSLLIFINMYFFSYDL